MSEEEKKPEIWTPPETLDTNTQRYAWLLFMEWWKQHLDQVGLSDTAAQVIGTAYGVALAAAKLVRAAEIKAGGQ